VPQKRENAVKGAVVETRRPAAVIKSALLDIKRTLQISVASRYVVVKRSPLKNN
jgi:hypothetical protein